MLSGECQQAAWAGWLAVPEIFLLVPSESILSGSVIHTPPLFIPRRLPLLWPFPLIDAVFLTLLGILPPITLIILNLLLFLHMLLTNKDFISP